MGAGVGAQLLSVVFVWAPGVAPSSFGGAGVGAGGGAQQLRWCWRGRRGWRPIVSVARGLAPGVAPSSFGGAGVDSGVGAQLLSIVCVCGRRGWRPAASVVLGWESLEQQTEDRRRKYYQLRSNVTRILARRSRMKVQWGFVLLHEAPWMRSEACPRLRHIQGISQTPETAQRLLAIPVSASLLEDLPHNQISPPDLSPAGTLLNSSRGMSACVTMTVIVSSRCFWPL